jgi:RNA polymerase-binding transcription factor DksA
MALSDQLSDLAAKTKQLEDTAAAAKTQNRAKLEKERDKLHTDMQSEAKKLQAGAEKSKSDARTWWADMAANAEQQRNHLHAKIEERKTERKVDKAMRDADDAENYAVNMIQTAAYCIDAAEYAVADAVIARANADDLVTTS